MEEVGDKCSFSPRQKQRPCDPAEQKLDRNDKGGRESGNQIVVKDKMLGGFQSALLSFVGATFSVFLDFIYLKTMKVEQCIRKTSR